MKSAQRVVHRVFWFSTVGCLLAAASLFLPSATAQDAGGDPNLSPAAGQVLNLAESGISDDVMEAYIQNATTSFNLSADDVTYLRDQGLSSPVINAMMDRDRILQQQPPPAYNYNQQLYNGNGSAPAVLPPPAPADATPPAYVSDAPDDVNYFYSDLSPYGAWVNLEGYGWCWQPTAVVVNSGWQPYCDGGHWVYTDNGWFWDSDYSWGWAPFHYGRWFHHGRVGWVWFPDRVWGPAWVTWRMSGNDCGWAPLPLHATLDAAGGFYFNGVREGADFDFGLSASLFTFVSFNDFAGRDPAHHRLAPADVSRIYGRTTIINNYSAANGNFINHGIPVDRVASATHTTIRPIPIRQAPPGMTRPPGRGDATLAVYRRDVRAPSRPVAVRAQQVDDRHPVVQHVVVPAANEPRPNSPAPTRPAVLPPSAPVRPPVSSPSHQVNSAPQPPSRTSSVVSTSPPPVHGRTPIPQPRNVHQPEPPTVEVGQADLPKPQAPTTAPTPQGPFDYRPRSATPAVESHSLPALPPKPAEPEPAGPSTVSHNYTPRMVQATQAHALPPLPTPARSQTPVSAPPPAASTTSSSGGKSSGGSGATGSPGQRQNH